MKAIKQADEPWTRAIERAGRGPAFLIEKPSPLSDALARESEIRKKERGPIWLGSAVRRDENFKLTKARPALWWNQMNP